MILETVFKYLKENGSCDINKISEALNISENRCSAVLLELQTRGAIKQETKNQNDNASDFCYSACMKEFHDYSEFCKCKTRRAITSDTESNDFGYWDTCCTCGKHLEDGFHYYNHYDGEDHDDFDF